MIDIAAIDQTVSREGQFCMLDWLLQHNHMAYSAYEDWRYGRIGYLESAFIIRQDELLLVLAQAQISCLKLKLACCDQDYFCWNDDHRQALRISTNNERNQLLGQRWVPRKDAPQMDLFMDNSAAIAENNLLALMADRHFAQAQNALQKIAQLNPAHQKLGGYQDLINYALHVTESAGVPSAALQAEVFGLDQEVAPLAKELLGAQQRDYLAFAWRRLANALRAATFSQAQLMAEPRLHYSYALLQIPDWGGINQYLSEDPALYQSPQLLARLALACWHSQQGGLSYWLWGLLFERFSDHAETLLATHGQYLLPDWDNFLSFDQDWSAEYLLGFLLIQQPGLIHLYHRLPRSELELIQHPANAAVYDLLKSRIAEGDETNARIALQRHQPTLLRCYLLTR